MGNRTQLTPRGAVLAALVCIACGVLPILGGFGVIPIHLENGTPGCVAIAAGSTFLLAAGALLVDAAAGGIGPTGNLPPDTPGALRNVQNLCGFGIVVLFALITSWIAFGKGERHFSTTLALPFMLARHASGDASGRWAFGIVAVVLWIVVIAVCANVLRRAIPERQRL